MPTVTLRPDVTDRDQHGQHGTAPRNWAPCRCAVPASSSPREPPPYVPEGGGGGQAAAVAWPADAVADQPDQGRRRTSRYMSTIGSMCSRHSATCARLLVESLARW